MRKSFFKNVAFIVLPFLFSLTYADDYVKIPANPEFTFARGLNSEQATSGPSREAPSRDHQQAPPRKKRF